MCECYNFRKQFSVTWVNVKILNKTSEFQKQQWIKNLLTRV